MKARHRLAAIFARPAARSSRAAGARLRRSALAATLALLAFAGIAAPAALAAPTHLFQQSFGPAAHLGGPQGVAVAPTSEEVYATGYDTESGQQRLFKFDPASGELDPAFGEGGVLTGASVPAGSFTYLWGLATDPATGGLYLADNGSGTVYKFTESGALIASFGDHENEAAEPEPDGTLRGAKTPAAGFSATGLAVDPTSGDLYVADAGNSVIDVFDSSGAYLRQFPTNNPANGQPELYGPSGVAIDSEGHLYVSGSGFTERYSPTGEPEATVDPFLGSNGVAVDPSTDELYVADYNQIVQYGSAAGLSLGEANDKVASFGTAFMPTPISYATAVAIDGAGEVFVADAGNSLIDEFGPQVNVEAPLVSNLQVSNITAESAHFSATVNSGGTDPLSDTTYSFSCAPDCPGLQSDRSVPTDGADHPVSDDTTDLLPNTTYQVTLTATDAAGFTATDTTGFTTAAIPPDVTTEPAEDVALTHASLQGLINPHNAPTTYHFEYGTADCASGPCTSIPSADADAGSGNGVEKVIKPLYGLTPGTTYHYRLVATNLAGTTTGADETFTTTTSAQPASCPNDAFRTSVAASRLPDCRAYEMVSPLDKHGGEVMPHTQRTHAADGEAPGLPMAVAFTSLAGFGDVHGDTVTSEYLSQRTAQSGTQGWSTHAITPVQQPTDLIALAFAFDQDPSYVGDFSDDLTRAAFRSWSPLTDAPNVAAVPNLYARNDLRSPGSGSYTLLSDAASPLTHSLARPFFAAASADFSHVIFESFQSLTPEVPACTPGPFGIGCPQHLYEAVDGVVRLAGVLPEGACGSPPPCVAGSSIAGQGQQLPGNAPAQHTPHTISDDGRRVFFTDTSTGTGQGDGDLYMRVDGATTVQLNASESGNPSGLATYWDASADGGRVFFTSTAALTSDTPADGHTRLFMYSVQPDEVGHHLTRVADSGGGVIGASDDGHYVYFVGGGGLAVWHDETGTPRTDPIGPLTTEDLRHDLSNTNWFFFPKASRVAPDGTHLLFAASDGSGLAGYDQTGACGAGGGFDDLNGCTELYLYSVHGEGPGHAHLYCASCDPGGTPAVSDAMDTVRTEAIAAQEADHSARAISDDGRFVFFHTPDPLVPQDVNGKFDVYEYDLADGSVHLLSSGTDPSASYFLDASADGHDVFFTTRARLTGWDRDSSRDLYDARINGGVADPVPGPLPCTEDACQGASSAPPGAPAPGSATLTGPGNPNRAANRPGRRHRCRRGFVKRRVHGHRRCVPKHKHARHSARRGAAAPLRALRTGR